VIERARRAGWHAVDVAHDLPRLIEARLTERTLRAKLDANVRAIGKRVLAIHRRTRVPASGPFHRFSALAKKLESQRQLEHEYLTNKARLGALRAHMLRGRTRDRA
jgi:hypothetical protein